MKGILSKLLAVGCLVVVNGCAPLKQIRVQNVSTQNFTNVSIAGQDHGDIGPGKMTDYKNVKLKFRNAALELHVDGTYVTGQTLNVGAKRFTYRIGVEDPVVVPVEGRACRRRGTYSEREHREQSQSWNDRSVSHHGPHSGIRV